MDERQSQNVTKRKQTAICCYCEKVKFRNETSVPISEETKMKWVAILGERFAKNMRRKKQGFICKSHFNGFVAYRKQCLPIKMSEEEEQHILLRNAISQNRFSMAPVPVDPIFGANWCQFPRQPFAENANQSNNNGPIDFDEICQVGMTLPPPNLIPVRSREEEDDGVENNENVRMFGDLLIPQNQLDQVENAQTPVENINSRVLEELENVERDETMPQEQTPVENINSRVLEELENVERDETMPQEVTQNRFYMASVPVDPIFGERPSFAENVNQYNNSGQTDFTTNEFLSEIIEAAITLPPPNLIPKRNRDGEETENNEENVEMLENVLNLENQRNQAENEQTPGERITGRILGGELGNVEADETMPQDEARVPVKIEAQQILEPVENEDPEIQIIVPIKTENPITTSTCRVCGRVCDIKSMTPIPTRTPTLLKWCKILGSDFINNIHSNDSPHYICYFHLRHIVDQLCKEP